MIGEFDFSEDKKTYSIYAPNGIMKTSFAKTFKDYSENKDSKDLAYPDRITKRQITIDWDDDISQDSVFVINSYDETFSSNKISTLLVNLGLKTKYDEIYKELEDHESEVIKKLKEISKSTDCKWEILSAFSSSERKTILDIFLSIKEKLEWDAPIYDFKYNDIFDSKGNVKKFLDKYKTQIEEYVQKYNEMIEWSEFFSNEWSKFWTYQAKELWNAIKDNAFFEAGHKIILKNKKNISSLVTYNKLLQDEIERVIDNPDLKKVFETIDKAIDANAELRSFHKILDKNNALLVKLNNYEEFRKELWMSYFSQIQSDILSLVELYEEKAPMLKDIVEEAKGTVTLWQNAIDEFNDRFINMPFYLVIENQEDAMLKVSQPLLKFYFKDWTEPVQQSKESLLTILSQWEKRALYLLNIIFEIQARKKEQQKTIFIIDDIADSFDYKNKYAIIQYLKDINETECFYQIILTHNFDFFRILESRYISKRKQCKMITKLEEKLCLVNADWLNPIDYFKNNFHKDSKILIWIIPFIRQLSTYCGFSDIAIKLTSLLHIKPDSKEIKISDLEWMIKTILQWITVNIEGDRTKTVLDLIFEAATWIYNEQNDHTLHLENKIVLSIAIRLKAEQYMIEKIDDHEFINSIGRNQTIELLNKYKDLFPSEVENLKILDEVNLITPESIHLNSFMYEPILDMSEEFLKKLYHKVNNFKK